MKEFDKYGTRSPDYHYRQVNKKSIKECNAQVVARFESLVEEVATIAQGRKLKLLDMGCGDGVALHLLSRRLPHLELYGIEPVTEALEVARTKTPQATFYQGNADSLPLPDEFFDIIISSDVIEHIENPDRMLEEARRLLKDDGTAIIGTPIRHSKFPLDHNHVQEFFLEDFETLCKRHFSKVAITETHNLSQVLLYNAPTRSFLNYRYLINLLNLFGWNPFMRSRNSKVEMFAYMYALCKK